MNRSKCETCRDWVPSDRVQRDGKVFLVKDCPKCGENGSANSPDAARHYIKRDADPGLEVPDCVANCFDCAGHRTPSYAFVNVTNRCNLNCPMSADSVPSHGFIFEPPIEHIEKIFQHLATFDPLPTIALFGGEPTVRKDIVEIVTLATRKYGFKCRVLTNGIRLADEELCRKLLEAKAHLLISYNGTNPRTYHQLRNNEKALDAKQKAIANVRKARRAKVSYVHCLAWGFNDKGLPDLMQFLHPQTATSSTAST